MSRAGDDLAEVFSFLLPVIREDEREATLRLLEGLPDRDDLAMMLGLIDTPPKVEAPVVKVKRVSKSKKVWCEIHGIAREPIPSEPNRTRCIECYKARSLARYYATLGRVQPEKVRQYTKRKA